MINGFRNLPINANLEAREKTRRRVVSGTVYFYMGAAEGCGVANYYSKKETMKRVLEIRAAEGGEDAKLFTRDLAQAYAKHFGRVG